jgi:hypothetical protein
MNRFAINLASRPFHNNAVYWIVLALSVATLSGFTWYTAHDYRTTSAELEMWTSRIEGRREALQGLAGEVADMNAAIAKLNLDTLSARGSFANAIIMGRLFSWSTLFERLEETLPEKVRLRSIRPGITREGIEVSVDGATRDHNSLLDFEEALLESEYFGLVYPLQESSRKREGEIQFNLAFAYLPEGETAVVEEEPPPPDEGFVSLDDIPETDSGDEYESEEMDEAAEPDVVEEDSDGEESGPAAEGETSGADGAERSP